MQEMPERPVPAESDGKPEPEHYINLDRLKRSKEDYDAIMKEISRLLDELEKEMQ